MNNGLLYALRELNQKQNMMQQIAGISLSCWNTRNQLQNMRQQMVGSLGSLAFARPNLDSIRCNLGLMVGLEKSINQYKSIYASPGGMINEFKNLVPYPNVLIDRYLNQQRTIAGLEQSIISSTKLGLAGSETMFSSLLTNALAGIHVISSAYNILPNTLSAALQVPMKYQDFIVHQLKRAQNDTAEIRRRRVLITELAGDLFGTSQAAVEMGMVSSSEHIDIEPLLQETNIYSSLNQHLAYLYDRNKSRDIYLAFADSLPAQINSLGGAIIEMVYLCNEFEKRGSRDEIFKPTNKSMRACCIITNLVADNEVTFADINDHLYFLLYEGSGGASRLTDKLSDDQLEPLWILKNLRRGFRHDLEHGEEREIKKKIIRVGDAYNELISKTVPEAPLDWKRAQHTLYKMLAEMLNRLREIQAAGQKGE